MIHDKINEDIENIVFRKFSISLHSAMLKNFPEIDILKINKVRIDTSYVYYQNKEQGYKQSLAWILDMYDDNGIYKNGWISVPKLPKQKHTYESLYNAIKSIKYRF